MSATVPPAGAEPPVLRTGAPPPGTRLSAHFRGCFACGEDQAGLHLVAVVGDGLRVVAEFTVTTAHQGAPSLAHGGVLATAVDEAMGYVLSLIGEPAVTAHLEIDYRLPVPVGTRLTLGAEGVARVGRKIWTTVEGRLESGQTAFTGSAMFLTVGVEHFTAHARPEDISDSIIARYNP